MKENSYYDRKSLSLITGKNVQWKELAKDCVCFSNGVGGYIDIGIEDNEDLPSEDQKIEEDLVGLIQKKISSLTHNVIIIPTKMEAENGGEYIRIQVLRNQQSIASTTTGKYYMRISDECKPVLSEDLQRLFSEKTSFVWEENRSRDILYSDADPEKLGNFIEDVRTSERVSKFVKEKSTEEICEYYFLTKEGYLTNLGILWIGKRNDRATLHYPPAVQFIKYDEREKKVFKKSWDDYFENPKELIGEILNGIPEWDEYIEVPDGIFRKHIYNYSPEVIREIIVNAFAHRNYTMRGDIFINLFIDRLEVHSPGLLPLGVTPSNILTQSVQRNRMLCKLFYDLKLMEKEGSGYDKIYEILLGDGKELPLVEEGDDRVVVVIKKHIIDHSVLRLMDKASRELPLSQKEIITLGLIAQKEGLSSLDLTKALNIKRPNGLNHWIGKLIEVGLLLSRGKTKGTFYYVNPEFLRSSNFIERTNLKRIEPHRLQELIYEDLKNYPGSAIGEIHLRVGKEIKKRTLKAKLDDMIANELIRKEGKKRGTKYFIDIKA